MTRRPWLRPLVAFGAIVVGSALFTPTPGSQQSPQRFPHEQHERVFPLCVSCHAGVVTPGASLWPEPSGCATCHDGTIERRVEWRPRTTPRVSNLRFTHEAHSVAATAKEPADSALLRDCAACHVPTGESRMTVRAPIVTQCLTCHKLTAPHVDNPPAACTTCHLRLTDAPTLTRAAITRFPKPTSHEAPDFVLGGHGKAARGTTASCATCHSRDLCLSCHVNAPELGPIATLALDDRPPPYAGSQPVPATHRAAGFLQVHGRAARRTDATCATCHTRESCTTCHQGTQPLSVGKLSLAGEGRASGAHTVRRPPITHDADFREQHGPLANARPNTCETCHQRSTCLGCHRPDGARQSAYHPATFLTRHPSAAYAREANCSDCHNPAQFCQTCHQRAGLVATVRIGRLGYHDAFRGFSLGHGQAARQSLESCVGCHVERDCTACHSAVGGGYRFNPHGPGFNGERALARNPSVCIACHGRAIPRR